MSQHAAEFYAEIAKTHGIHSIPDILDGSPIYLLPPDKNLSINSINLGTDKATQSEVRNAYADVIASLRQFVLDCASGELCEVDPGAQNRAEALSRRHLHGMIGQLLKPKYLNTGSLRNLQIQAATPDDFPDTYLSYALHLEQRTPEELHQVLGRTVLLVTSAGLYPQTAASESYTAFLTMVRPLRGPAISTTGRQFTRGEIRRMGRLWQAT